MDNELSVLVEGVLREAERVGLAGTSIKYYRRCCTAVVLFCRRRGIERLTPQALEEFLEAMDQRALLGEIGPVYRSTLEKTARMMREFDQTGIVVWRRRRPLRRSARRTRRSSRHSPSRWARSCQRARSALSRTRRVSSCGSLKPPVLAWIR